MTVAELVFYDVPGHGDVAVRIERYDSGYRAKVPGAIWNGLYPTLLDALVGVRKYLDVISRANRARQSGLPRLTGIVEKEIDL